MLRTTFMFPAVQNSQCECGEPIASNQEICFGCFLAEQGVSTKNIRIATNTVKQVEKALERGEESVQIGATSLQLVSTEPMLLLDVPPTIH